MEQLNPGYHLGSIRLVRKDNTIQVPAHLIERAIGRTWRRQVEPLYVHFAQRGSMVRMIFHPDRRGWKLWDLTPRDMESRTARVHLRSTPLLRAWLPRGWDAAYVTPARITQAAIEFNLRSLRKWKRPY